MLTKHLIPWNRRHIHLKKPLHLSLHNTITDEYFCNGPASLCLIMFTDMSEKGGLMLSQYFCIWSLEVNKGKLLWQGMKTKMKKKKNILASVLLLTKFFQRCGLKSSWWTWSLYSNSKQISCFHISSWSEIIIFFSEVAETLSNYWAVLLLLLYRTS